MLNKLLKERENAGLLSARDFVTVAPAGMSAFSPAYWEFEARL